MARSLLFYPLVGLLLGIVLWALSLLLMQLPPLLTAAALLIAWVLMTGGLHLDGLADSADAWAGGYGDRQKTLDIMKDPTAGPLAVVVLVLLLIVKFASLAVLLEADAMQWFVCVPVLGRMAVLVLFLTTPYVREQGLASRVEAHFNQRAAQLVLIISLLAILLWLPFTWGLFVMVCAVLLLTGLRQMMMQRLQGMTGDTLGASVELLEAVCVFVLAAVVSLPA